MKSTIRSERLYHDLATVEAPVDVSEKVSKPVWQFIVDKVTGMKFFTFHKIKDVILNDISAQLKTMERIPGREIQVWCQDDAGENKVLERI